MNATSFFKQLIHQVKTDPIPDWAATLAYFFMLSIFPLMIFMVALLPYFEIEESQLYVFVDDYFPGEIGDLFASTVLEVISQPQGGLLSFGVIAAIWSASNGVNALIRAVNRSYGIEETRHFLKLRIQSVLLTIGMIVVIVTTLLLPVFGESIIRLLESYLFLPDGTAPLLNTLRWGVGISLMTVFLMLLYWYSPNVRLRFREVVIGAVFATVGWQLISYGFSAYVSNFGNYSATYGSLGGVIILMLWFFLSGVILVLGGEINAALFRLKRSSIPPS